VLVEQIEEVLTAALASYAAEPEFAPALIHEELALAEA
jgi:hypothetical protein